MTRSYRHLLKTKRPYEAVQIIASQMYAKQEKDYPVSAWRLLQETTPRVFDDKVIVKHKMSTDIFSVNENDSIQLVLNIMKWKQINHMPVINSKRELVGLLSWTDVKTYVADENKQRDSVDTIMKKNIYTTTQYEKIKEAKALMAKHNIHCLPVIRGNKLFGIITSKDI